MFGDLMGNMQEKQAEMKSKLEAITVSVEKDGILIQGNANKQISNISIDEKYTSPERKEELEDLLIVSLNSFIDSTIEEEAKASQSMLEDLMPGMGDMFGA